MIKDNRKPKIYDLMTVILIMIFLNCSHRSSQGNFRFEGRRNKLILFLFVIVALSCVAQAQDNTADYWKGKASSYSSEKSYDML